MTLKTVFLIEDIPVISILLTCLHLWNIACRLPKAEEIWINAAHMDFFKVKSAILDTILLHNYKWYVGALYVFSFMEHVHSYTFVKGY